MHQFTTRRKQLSKNKRIGVEHPLSCHCERNKAPVYDKITTEAYPKTKGLVLSIHCPATAKEK
eukprot:Awhi_evm2s7115